MPESRTLLTIRMARLELEVKVDLDLDLGLEEADLLDR